VNGDLPRSILCVMMLSLFLGGAIGCGSDETLPETAAVTGTITYNGSPIRGGTITFHPQGTGNPAYGLVTPDGTYSLTTYHTDDGAVLGEHVVTVEVMPGQWAAEADAENAGLPGTENSSSGPRIPPAYSSAETTPLRYTVKSGTNTADFVLED